MSVQACLDYFDTHGVIELPTNKCYEDIYRPPIVDKPIDPIVSTSLYSLLLLLLLLFLFFFYKNISILQESLWDDLPIEEHVKNVIT